MSWSQVARTRCLFAGLLGLSLFQFSSLAFSTPTEVSGHVWAGYQAWFSAGPNDPNGIQNWFHLAKDQSQAPAVGNFNVDLWPDMSIYPQNSRISVNAIGADGQPLQIFSSGENEVIKTHLSLMQSYGIAGPFVQRFLSDIKDPNLKIWKNQILDRVRAAARASDRTFAIMYDLSGVSNAQIQQILLSDISELETQGLFHDPHALTRGGKPVVALWGLGFNDRDTDPELILSIVQQLKQKGFAVMGGVPFFYGRGGGDVSTDPRWKNIFSALDVISPWAVGRYANLAELQNSAAQIKSDVETSARLGQVYMPVVFPGFSWKNLTAGKSPSNQIPRAGGQFFWDQARFYSSLGVKTIYIAMFDELDEGTAILPLVAKKAMLPLRSNLLAIDEDGFDLPSDFYLRMTRLLAERAQAGQNLEPKVPYSALLR